jgi:Tfp pilus assembly protein PilF
MFKEAIKTDTSYARAYFNLGRAFRQKGLYEESEKAMRKARALASKKG